MGGCSGSKQIKGENCPFHKKMRKNMFASIINTSLPQHIFHFVLCFETGSYYITLAGLESAMLRRLALTSEIHLPLPL